MKKVVTLLFALALVSCRPAEIYSGTTATADWLVANIAR
jgi:hypothetical protein